MKRLHCFLIPLHNEHQVLRNTIVSLYKAGVAWEDMYYVDDGSTDDTFEILNRITFPYLPMSNMLFLEKNLGKTGALITAFAHFQLAEKYTWMNTLDGDTQLRTDYMKNLIPLLNDQPQSTAAVASRVCSVGTSWNPFVSYRVYEYWLMQQAYKRAQGHLNILTVLPGCGTTFRTEVFKILSDTPDPSMLTEDMDFTIRIHREQLGRLIYSHDTVVITQDPGNIKDYKKQNTRWFEGGWQVYLKHRMWQVFNSKINAETSFLFLEGLFFSSLFVFALGAAVCRILPMFVHYFFLFDTFIFTLLGILAAIAEWNIRLILYMPVFYLCRVVKCIIFLHGFIRIIIFKVDRHEKLQWNQVKRY